jgi:hypothetical protein
MSVIEQVLVDIRALFMKEKIGSVREVILKIEKQPSRYFQQRDIITLDIQYEKIEEESDEEKSWTEESSWAGSRKSLNKNEKSGLEPIKE